MIVALVAWRNRKAKGAFPIFWTMVGTAVWSGAYAVSFTCTGTQEQLFWFNFTFIGCYIAAISLPAFALLFTGKDRHIKLKYLHILSAFALIGIAAAYTDPLHHLFYTTCYSVRDSDGFILHTEKYIGYYFFAISFPLTMTLTSVAILVREYFRVQLLQKKQIKAMLIVIAITWVMTFQSLAGLTPLPDVDLTPSALSVQCAIILYIILRFRFLNVAPFAREKMLEVMDTGLIALDMDYTIVEVNPYSEAVFNFKARDVIGKNLSNCDFPNRPAIEFFLTTGMEKTGIIFGKDNVRYFEMTQTPIIIKTKEKIGVLLTFNDITHMKESEASISRSEQAFRNIVETSPDGITLFNYEGKLTFASEKAYRMFGYDRPEAVHGKSYLEFIQPGFKEIALEAFTKMQNGYDIGGLEYKVISKDGNEFWCGINAAIQRDAAGKPCEFLFMLRDINLRKKYEEDLKNLLIELKNSNDLNEENLRIKSSLIKELEESKKQLERINNEKDVFFSIIAHDLKNPFFGLIGLSKILAEEFADLTPEEVSAITLSLNKSAENLYKLLENLLEWSRLQRGAMQYMPSQYNLKGLVAGVMELIGQSAVNKDIDVTQDIPDDCVAWCDKNMIGTVIRNIVSNSVKFSYRKGKIGITAGKEQDRVTLVVHDNGVGMSDEILEKLFRIDKKITSKGTEGEVSSGLGLILCRELIEKNYGTIEVTSKFGIGTTVRITLPADPGENGGVSC